MFKIKCKCETQEKSFKINIGEFFIADCCTKAGYDNKGLKAGDEAPSEGNDSEPQNSTEPQLEGSAKDMFEALNEKTGKELMAFCLANKIQFTKKDTKVKLLERIKEAFLKA